MGEQTPYPLFKGATRIPLVLGVPIIPGLIAFGSVASAAMLTSLWTWIALLPIWFGMRIIIKNDDRAFNIVGLWFDTKFRNKNKKLWRASSYTPVSYARNRK